MSYGFARSADGARAYDYFREAWAMSIAYPSMFEWRVAQLLLYGLRDRVGVDPIEAPTTATYAPGDFLNVELAGESLPRSLAHELQGRTTAAVGQANSSGTRRQADARYG